ncbi:MAG: LLM class flavin-dependent oxidoreductase [Acidimicrobiaceae bacterium]|nr:LLM class flavin-dependent oxidoreductase [Acidimicrobiaceae bacterium]
MKIRIGYGIGAVPKLLSRADGLATVVDDLDRLGFDSLWFPERVNSPQLDPIAAMGFVAGRSSRLKFGPAVSVLPGRNPVLMAKMLASLDVISGGRCLPAFGLGIANAAEHQAFGVERMQRAPWLNEAMPLMRRLWSEDEVDHDGERFSLRGARVLPKPIQQPFEVWLGGRAPSELRRAGRLADGWLGSFTTPELAAESITVIEEAARAAGRSMDPEHYGILIPYLPEPPNRGETGIPDSVSQLVASRMPGTDPREIVATSHKRIAELLNEYIAVGASKFVLFPFTEPADWRRELDALAQLAMPLQT